jgi:hypothetical protein
MTGILGSTGLSIGGSSIRRYCLRGNIQPLENPGCKAAPSKRAGAVFYESVTMESCDCPPNTWVFPPAAARTFRALPVLISVPASQRARLCAIPRLAAVRHRLASDA